jgi:hypothetical protein
MVPTPCCCNSRLCKKIHLVVIFWIILLWKTNLISDTTNFIGSNLLGSKHDPSIQTLPHSTSARSTAFQKQALTVIPTKFMFLQPNLSWYYSLFDCALHHPVLRVQFSNHPGNRGSIQYFAQDFLGQFNLRIRIQANTIHEWFNGTIAA